MALYVLGDTHLSLGASKPMDVFPGWNGYVERLERNWRKLIKPEDTTFFRLFFCRFFQLFQLFPRKPGQLFILR